MNITKTQIDDLNASIKIELSKEDYSEGVEIALKDYQRKVDVKGFRKGKAPMGIVKKMYGKALLADEINKVLGDTLSNYIKENDLQILGEPLPNETDQKEFSLDEEVFEFLYDIAISPEVNAKLSKREKVVYYSIKVDDEMIDKQIESICKNNAEMLPVDEIEGTEYLKGELVELDENGAIKEGGLANDDASMSLFYMKDDESLTLFKGKKIGEEVKFNAVKSFPNKTDFAAMLGVSKEEAEHSNENYCLVIKEIKRHVDAEVNEALFTKMYGEEVKNIADFRTRIKGDIENQLQGHSDYRFTVDAKEKMVKKNEDVVLPEAFLKRWILATNENMKVEDLDRDFEAYKDDFKWELIKVALVKEFDVKMELEDMQKEARNVAAAQLQQYGLNNLSDEQLDGFASKLLEDEKQRKGLYERALDNKVFGVIKENVKIEDQEITMADFEKLFKK